MVSACQPQAWPRGADPEPQWSSTGLGAVVQASLASTAWLGICHPWHPQERTPEPGLPWSQCPVLSQPPDSSGHVQNMIASSRCQVGLARD